MFRGGKIAFGKIDKLPIICASARTVHNNLDVRV